MLDHRLLPLLLLLHSTPTSAQPLAEATASPSAIDLGRVGLAHYERGAWEDAYSAFEKAEATAHSPVFQLYMARCKRQSGKLIVARALYQKVAEHDLGSDVPPPWKEAISNAREELKTLAEDTPSVIIPGARSSHILRVSLAGHEVLVTDEAQQIEVDPGTYVAVLWDRHDQPTARKLELKAGDRLALNLSVEEPIPKRADPAPPSAAPAKDATPAAESASWRRTLGFAAVAVGAVGIGTGVVAGLIAAEKARELDCPNGVCPRSEATTAREGSKWASVSTVGFIFGGAAAAAGVALLIIVPANDRTAGTIAISGRF